MSKAIFALSPQESSIVECVEREVRRRLAAISAGHGMDHILRVVANAQRIAEEVGGNRLVILLAALLHDVGDAKFHDGQERSAEFSREILAQQPVTAEIVEHVAHIVDNISFRVRHRAASLSLEGQIVQDADRIDALGAVGIVRTIEFGAFRGQPFFDSAADEQQGTGLGHFYEKLFKLKALMNTEPGRRLAAEREAIMRDFVRQFLEEHGLPAEEVSCPTA